MKLAFCLYHYFPFGGMQRDFLRIAKACLAKGYQVHVFTLSWQGPRLPNLPVHIVPMKAWRNHRLYLKFAEYIKEHVQGFDRIVGFNKMPGLDVYFAADPCYQAKALHNRSWWYRCLARYHTLHALEQAVLQPKASTKILALTHRQCQDFITYYQTPAERIHLLAPGLAYPALNAAQRSTLRQRLREDYGVDEGESVLLFIAARFKTKGLDRAIRALAALSNLLRATTRLWVIGNDHKQAYIRLAHRLGIQSQIHFLGAHDNVQAFLAAADLLIHPAREEAAGLVILEALASGLPVLSVDICGYADYVVQAGAGRILSTPFNQSELDQTLQAILQDTEYRQQAESNALQFAAQTNLHGLVEQVVQHIEQGAPCCT